MIDSVATIGDAGDLGCWSGTPYRFIEAAKSLGCDATPWRLDMAAFEWPRRFWNLRRLLAGRGRGGFQYSREFSRRALGMVDKRLLGGRIVAFNQHFPSVQDVEGSGGRICFYLDATFPLLLERYSLAATLPRDVQEKCLEAEREAFQRAERLVFFQRWSAESAVRDCGADPRKVSVICPGANFELPEDWRPQFKPGSPSDSRPLVLGFVGKDWKRKGLPFLLDVRRQLARMGVPTVVRCAGPITDSAPKEPGVEHWGFINKATEGKRFLDFIRSCDVGCLFSEAEASSIAILEFLRAGIPVAGFTVDGMADLFPHDASFAFSPGTDSFTVAASIKATYANEGAVLKLRSCARQWSPLVTWERCVREWKELLLTGAIAEPVQLWRGLQQVAP